MVARFMTPAPHARGVQRPPSGSRRKWLLVDVALREIARVVDDRRDHEPLVAVRRRETREVLRDDGVLAVRHAVAAQPAAASGSSS